MFLPIWLNDGRQTVVSTGRCWRATTEVLARMPRSLSFAGPRAIACFGLLALLAACSGGGGPRTSGSVEAARYAAHARGNYAPPGPPGDPWGPYITEAANRYDVPDRWIRAVMRVESGGH